MLNGIRMNLIHDVSGSVEKSSSELKYMDLTSLQNKRKVLKMEKISEICLFSKWHYNWKFAVFRVKYDFRSIDHFQLTFENC